MAAGFGRSEIRHTAASDGAEMKVVDYNRSMATVAKNVFLGKAVIAPPYQILLCDPILDYFLEDMSTNVE